jgi:transposase
MYYAGVDAHKRYSRVVVTDQSGQRITQASLDNDQKAFEEFFHDYLPAKAVVEASRTWGVVYDILEEIGVQPVLANPLKTRAIAEARIKTDTIDATTLSNLLRADLIPAVHVPSKEVRSQKNLLRQRLWLVGLKTMVKNRIHDILDRNHVALPPAKDIFGRSGRRFLAELVLASPDDSLLEAHLALLDHILEQIKGAEKWIDEALEDHPGVAVVNSLPGFGRVLSALVALEIDEISRFNRPDKLCAYAGLVPTTYASGGKVYHGRLLPSCNRWLRWAFVEASWVAQRTSPYCHAYYERIKRRKGANSANTALARRLCEITWHCLKENRHYQERGPTIINKELPRPPSQVLGHNRAS